LKLVLAQMSMSMDRGSNVKKALEEIDVASSKGGDLIFFPEAQLTPFFPQYPGALLLGMGIHREAFSVPSNSEILSQFQEKAKEHGIYISPNFYVKDTDGHLYDRSYMIDCAGNVQGSSDMVHIYSAPNFYERDYYSPSKDGFRVYDTPFGRIGIVICFDRHLPESVRACALQGAQLVLIPTANLTEEPMDLFLSEIRTEAFHNNIFIAMCNRVGEEDAITFSGQSLVAGPDGEVLAQAGSGEENLLVEIDLGEALRSRMKRNYIQFVTADRNVYHMEGSFRDDRKASIEDVYHAMAKYDEGDPIRIQHFTKVWTYARLIGLGEGLPSGLQTILEVASIVHDIGIHKAEKNFGSSNGKLQEKLGPEEALILLTDLGLDRTLIERVMYLVGHHHTYTDIEGLDYQILVEADFLVNIYEDELSMDAARSAYDKIFITKTGKKMFQSLYPEALQ